jgi:hypothetical protein
LKLGIATVRPVFVYECKFLIGCVLVSRLPNTVKQVEKPGRFLQLGLNTDVTKPATQAVKLPAAAHGDDDDDSD